MYLPIIYVKLPIVRRKRTHPMIPKEDSASRNGLMVVVVVVVVGVVVVVVLVVVLVVVVGSEVQLMRRQSTGSSCI